MKHAFLSLILSIFCISQIHLKLPTDEDIGSKISILIKTTIHSNYPSNFPKQNLPFIQWAFKQIGITIPKTIPFLSEVGEEILYNSITIGDILFFSQNNLGINTVGIVIDTYTMAYIPPNEENIIEVDFTDSKWKQFFTSARRIYANEHVLTALELMYQPEITQSAFTTYIDPNGYHNPDPGYLRFYIQDIREADILISSDNNDTVQVFGENENNPNMPKHIINKGYIGYEHQYTSEKRPLIKKPSTEFICIHDTGDGDQTAYDWTITEQESMNNISWHFTVDDNDIYQLLPLDEVGRHAGDHANLYELLRTNITFENDNPTLEFNPEDTYLYINGHKSNLTAPPNCSRYDITTAGLYVEVHDNVYYVNKYHFSDLKWISNGGGNRNSIGIETCIYNGTIYSKTMRKTANLVAHLLKMNNLGLHRVMQHRHFSGKTCPQSMIRATPGCTFEYKQLTAMIEMEYFILMNMPDAKFSYVSLNPNLLDNEGMVLKYVEKDTEVSYKVIVEYDGIITERTFTTLIRKNPGPFPDIPAGVRMLNCNVGFILMLFVALLLG